MQVNYSLTVNGQRRAVWAAPDTPLLWVLRDTITRVRRLPIRPEALRAL